MLLSHCCRVKGTQAGKVTDMSEAPLTHSNFLTLTVRPKVTQRTAWNTTVLRFSGSTVWLRGHWICCCLRIFNISTWVEGKREEDAAEQVVRLCNLDLMATNKCTCTVDKGWGECWGWISGLSVSFLSPEIEKWGEDSRGLHWKAFFNPNPVKAQALLYKFI